MATQPVHPPRAARTAQPQTTAEPGPGVLDRWRARRAEKQQARLTNTRNRRVLARWLQRTANRTPRRHPLARRREALLDYRAAAVRTELLEIAALIEHTRTPDPVRVATLRNLLANGCDSPLYNPDIHMSELHATLHYIRSGL
jgi:hypothetical protein